MNSLLSFHNPDAHIPRWSCAKGERWLLSAPTGWGKTVWLKQLVLLRDAHTTELVWNGAAVTPQNVQIFRSRWNYLPQSPPRTPETVSTHLLAILSLEVFAERELSRDFLPAFRTVLAELGLGRMDVEKRTLQELSGGELQAISLIRSVLLQPEGLLLDEPTSAMDRELCLAVERWLLAKHEGAMVWVSHDLEQRARLEAQGFRSIPLG